MTLNYVMYLFPAGHRFLRSYGAHQGLCRGGVGHAAHVECANQHHLATGRCAFPGSTFDDDAMVVVRVILMMMFVVRVRAIASTMVMMMMIVIMMFPTDRKSVV